MMRNNIIASLFEHQMLEVGGVQILQIGGLGEMIPIYIRQKLVQKPRPLRLGKCSFLIDFMLVICVFSTIFKPVLKMIICIRGESRF